jgi:hypothetical protein
MKKFILLTIMSIAAGTLLAQTLPVCYGKGYTLSSTADAPATGATSYSWYEDGDLLDGENEASLIVAAGKTVGDYAYVRVAANEACPDGVPSNTFTVTVNPVPAIHTASQTVAQGTPISTIIYTASAGATISMTGSLPPGVNGTPSGASFTISGTPWASGTFGYALTSTTEEGCTSAVTAGTITVYMPSPPGNVPTTLCTACCHNGAAWVDCYVTTNAYPFDNNSTTITVNWMGGNTTYYSGAASDKDGRTNTAAITGSAGTSAVQLCKNLGCGWYLPAYEELQNMSARQHESYPSLNGFSGANLLATPTGYYWSSTEWYRNGGRYNTTDEGHKLNVPIVNTNGHISNVGKGNASYYVRCAWRP